MELCALKPQQAVSRHGRGSCAARQCGLAGFGWHAAEGEDAAENDPDVRVNSFSFLGSACVLHFLILVLFIFSSSCFPEVFLSHWQVSCRVSHLSAFP